MMAASTLRPLILICDDEMPLRELIKAALGDRYRYVEAATPTRPRRRSRPRARRRSCST